MGLAPLVSRNSCSLRAWPSSGTGTSLRAWPINGMLALRAIGGRHVSAWSAHGTNGPRRRPGKALAGRFPRQGARQGSVKGDPCLVHSLLAPLRATGMPWARHPWGARGDGRCPGARVVPHCGRHCHRVKPSSSSQFTVTVKKTLKMAGLRNLPRLLCRATKRAFQILAGAPPRKRPEEASPRAQVGVCRRSVLALLRVRS